MFPDYGLRLTTIRPFRNLYALFVLLHIVVWYAYTSNMAGILKAASSSWAHVLIPVFVGSVLLIVLVRGVVLRVLS
jgi:hypothetical protein